MIFIDAGAWIANFLRKDQHHRAARKAWSNLHRFAPLFTSNFVLDEAFTYVGLRVGNQFAAMQAERVYASEMLTILRPDQSVELKALQHFRKFADQAISFTDCTSFVLMRQNGIRTAFAFDRHFALAGFDMWPSPQR